MITGNNLIGYTSSGTSDVIFERELSLDGQATTVSFHEASPSEIDMAVTKAADSFKQYRKLSADKRAAFLQKIAVAIDASKEELTAMAMLETHLPEARLKGEVQRTLNQIKSFVDLLKEGSWVKAIIDTAQPERTPLPKADLRQMQIAMGPVGVFGASNFPFAFSVAGGDTISALAAGCTVVYKAHPGHPATSEKVGLLINQAARESDLPDGVFSLLQGESHQSGQTLVMHPMLKAIAFTGSFFGGKALFDAAAKRKEPIPVYAEMGSTNPVFILPEMLAKSGADIAGKLAPSNLLSAGQFCTNPGIVGYVQSEDAAAFKAQFAKLITDSCGDCMLTANIHKSYSSSIEKLRSFDEVELVSSGQQAKEPHAAMPYMFQTSASFMLQHDELMEEVFGPASIHAVAQTKEALLAMAEKLPGQLTASIWATENDLEEYAKLVDILEQKVGRVIYNGVPTGVEVTHAMVHGGPFPATTDSKTTSVGTNAIYRFTRPVCYQSSPQAQLPEALKDENSLGIWRQVNGQLTKELVNK